MIKKFKGSGHTVLMHQNGDGTLLVIGSQFYLNGYLHEVTGLNMFNGTITSKRIARQMNGRQVSFNSDKIWETPRRERIYTITIHHYDGFFYTDETPDTYENWVKAIDEVRNSVGLMWRELIETFCGMIHAYNKWTVSQCWNSDETFATYRKNKEMMQRAVSAVCGVLNHRSGFNFDNSNESYTQPGAWLSRNREEWNLEFRDIVRGNQYTRFIEQALHLCEWEGNRPKGITEEDVQNAMEVLFA